MIILDFIYVVNAWLVERRSCAFPLVAVTLLLICGSFVGIGFLFHHYAPQGSCSLNIWCVRALGLPAAGALAHAGAASTANRCSGACLLCLWRSVLLPIR